MRILALIASLLVTVGAYAADATLNWQNATQREDGSALALSEIRETQIDYAKCTAGTNNFPITADGTKVVPMVAGSPPTSTVIPGLAYGKWCFRARHVDTNGLSSVNSNTVWAQYVAPPKPPVLTTVGGLVWEFKLKNGEPQLARVVGTVEAGKPCSGLAPLTGFDLFQVARGDVALNEGLRPSGTLVAQCAIG